MHYAFLLTSYANPRYAQSLQKLASAECRCLLSAVGRQVEPRTEKIAGVPWLTFETEPLSDDAWRMLSRLSPAVFAAKWEGGVLHPLEMRRPAYLPEELAQILKYKGKTNVEFTRTMLHCARSASAFAGADEPLTVLDPMCGKGTTLFCALTEGDCAVGADVDERALAETDAYLSRYLQHEHYKHRREERSLTVQGARPVRERRYELADTPEHYRAGDTRNLRLLQADATMLDRVLKPESCHIAAVDLPYGVQHAPLEGRGVGSLTGLLHAALPGWRTALKQGGAIALAFNTYTLPRATVCQLVAEAGLDVLQAPPYNDFEHWVEQAVLRDLVIARKVTRD